ncbi:MAG: malto-oligosyltrehalose trehalohydrolase [Chloroflexota bacterium]|nr:malto-oligosyltrehalose trehalohydrolase [Chloroflexota bacterium]
MRDAVRREAGPAAGGLGGRPWRLDLGANVVDDGVRFRVWAPNARHVDVTLLVPSGPAYYPLAAEADGYYAVTVPGIGAGTRYKYRLDGGMEYPDPCSRFQPEGPHGPSEVVDPSAFRWTDGDWTGTGPDGLVIYELHVGTFTPEGTFDAIIPELRELTALGVTALEIMPVAEFPGRRNWGYDGVNLYAPESAYGGPEGLRRLVDAAHRQGLAVLLDVVYNHFGPDGNYLRAYATDYFTDRHTTPWGDAVNYDGPNSEHVRHFVLQNVRYWLEEYHLDGLRLDATHAIVDTSPRHILAEIARVVHGLSGRRAVAIAEDHRNDVRQIRPPTGDRPGLGLDGVWSDDFHHAMRTYLTPEREGYYASFSGSLADVARTIEGGFLYQGQAEPRSGKPRGTPVTDEPARAFVFCTENHDQVGNRAMGERLAHLVDRERYLLASTVLLFAPETPLLFQGQEFAASTPFQFFTEHNEELGKLVTAGRRNEFKSFSAFADPALRERIPDPQAEATFHRSTLVLEERERHREVYELYRSLLHLRRDDPVLRAQDRLATRAQAVGDHVLLVTRTHGGAVRLLVTNFGDVPIRVGKGAVWPSELVETSSWRALWATPNASPPSGPLGATPVEIPPRSARILARDPG